MPSRLALQSRGDDAPSADQYVVDGRRFSGTELFGAAAPVAESAGGLPGGRHRLPWRTMAIAAVLFATGLTFLLLGALHFWYVGRRGGGGRGDSSAAVGAVLPTSGALWRTRFACVGLGWSSWCSLS